LIFILFLKFFCFLEIFIWFEGLYSRYEEYLQRCNQLESENKILGDRKIALEMQYTALQDYVITLASENSLLKKTLRKSEQEIRVLCSELEELRCQIDKQSELLTSERKKNIEPYYKFVTTTN